jgi:hypothetical protein
MRRRAPGRRVAVLSAMNLSTISLDQLEHIIGGGVDYSLQSKWISSA